MEAPISPPPRLVIDIKSAAAFPSLSSTNKAAATTAKTGHISLSITPTMNYKASLEKVVPKTVAKPVLKVMNTPKQESKEFVYDDEYDCEDTIVHVEDEEEGEYNANIMSDRRRGDKGFW